ncbi:30S ribosomal protein S11 [Candidatus Bilamarchaeum dharawalense]|uniref:Small ribosomal subunit protein uS11 n=1 Tax=Candidatus Bilamarchaeum dharawalense TaxID=2885759 RepID=A0A5E4LMF4_9ARCH|nr:30S ribosomal protein S11 [Candidatus Bilamarchaeum dharawalense]
MTDPKPEIKTEVKKPEIKPDLKVEAKPEVKEEVKAEAPPKEEIKKPRKIRVAVVHVYSSKNDTIITATDVSGAETLAWASGGMMVKSHREEGRPYAAMQAAIKVVNTLKDKGITHVHVKIRAPGGAGTKTPGSGAQAVVRTIARTGVRIGRIEDVTPVPTDSMKRKGGRRGRRV